MKTLTRLTILAALLVLALPAGAQNTAVYIEQGGSKLVIGSGGTLELADGSTLTGAETMTFTLGADEYIQIDGATTAQTQTAGSLNLDFASITADANAFNLAATMNNGTASGTNVYASIWTLTANDADGDLFGLRIDAAATTNATANSYEYLIGLDCAENTAGACIDGILITSTGANTGLTDAIDVSASNITNAINIGGNLVVTDGGFNLNRATSGSVTVTCTDDDANCAMVYDAGGTGSVTVGSADVGSMTLTSNGTLAATAVDDISFTLTAGAAGEDFIVDQNGNYDASILLSTEGNGTDAIKLETLTNGGDIVVSSVDNVQVTSTTASGLIDIDGTAGLVYSIAEDDTTADTVVLGSAKDDITIAGEDITLTTADDLDITSTSASGIIALGGTPGVVINVGTDDTTADTIAIGSAKDDLTLAAEDITLTTADDVDITSTSASGIIALGGTPGLVFNIATDDTTADDINVGSAKDDITLSAEDITLTTADDVDITSTSASGIIYLGGTPGLAINIGTDDTTADAIAVGSAKDDVDLAGEDITLTSADDVAILSSSAGGILNVMTGTAGYAINIATDNTAADTVAIGSALDDVDLAGEDIALTSADDVAILGGSAGSIINIGTNNHGNVVNIATDNTAKDTVNIGSALDDVGLVSGAGAEAASGNVCAERCVGAICQTVCTLTAVVVAVTDPGGAAAYGGVKIYDFPLGYINRLGIVADITATEASASISDTWDGDVSFGSTAADSTATLHNPTTEDDWVPTAATTTAVSSVAASDTQSTVTEQTICDGHTTACDLYLNYEIDDGSISTGGPDQITVSGTITITWINLGDNG